MERSEGNPLFVEEIVRKLIDDGVLRATSAATWEVAKPTTDVELPRSIQGLIATRLDGLPADEKAVMQDAAVVGRVFWSGAVAALGGTDAGTGPGRPRPAPREGAGPAHRSAELVGRARVHVPPRADPRRRVRVAPEVAARHEARAGRAMGADEGRRPRGRDRGADRHPRAAGPALLRRTRRHVLPALARSRHRRSGGPGRPATERTRSACRPRPAAGTDKPFDCAELVGADVADRAAIARTLAEASFGTEPVEDTEQACRMALELYEEAGDERGAGWAESSLVMVLFNVGPGRGGAGDRRTRGPAARTAR